MRLSLTQKKDRNIFRRIFWDHWFGFKKKQPVYKSDQYEEVVQKMLGCGKEDGGYTEYMCMRCGKDKRKVAFTCKGYFCLSCAKVHADNFVVQVSKMLHAGVVYRHVVLTVPRQLRTYFYRFRHDGSFLTAFMHTGYECLEDAVRKIKKQDLKIGAIIVVQTHGRSGQYNPHLHIMMTDGGINEQAEKWVDVNFFPYEILRHKWQYHLLNMMKREVPTPEMRNLVDDLWKRYPKGFVANIKKGEVPRRCRGLAKYLAKYLASPPISLRRIIRYDGKSVRYWYRDHSCKRIKVETVDVYTFIGRMVQHILPKWFQRVRYFGLESTQSFSKWQDVIEKGLKRMGRVIKGSYQVVGRKKYRERYIEVSNRDPMICRYCGAEMDVSRIWHPKYGVIYDELEEIKAGKYEPLEEIEREETTSAHSSARFQQLSLFPLAA